MNAPRIAPVRVADLNDVTRIHAASFDDPWSVTMLKRILSMPGAGGLVARDGSRRSGRWASPCRASPATNASSSPSRSIPATAGSASGACC